MGHVSAIPEYQWATKPTYHVENYKLEARSTSAKVEFRGRNG